MGIVWPIRGFRRGSRADSHRGVTRSSHDDGGADTDEDFSNGWLSNQNASPTIIALVYAVYDGTPGETVEDFEEAFTDKEYTVDISTDVLTSAGHGLLNGATVFVRAQTGGKLPTGTNGTVRYFAEVLSVDTMKLHTASVAGPVVNFQDVGEGTQRLIADPDRYWPGELIDSTP